MISKESVMNIYLIKNKLDRGRGQDRDHRVEMLDVIVIIGPVEVDPDPDRGRMIVIGEEGVVIRVAMIEEDLQKGY